jgi:hypothetical protein
MNYKSNFIVGKTIEELKAELQQMYDDQYSYGRGIDRCRMWDINYTVSFLESR